MKVLVTGSNGFIGKNLTTFLRKNNFEIITHVKEDSLDELIEKISIANAIIHLAGLNRTTQNILFKENNENLTEFICKVLIEKKIEIPIFFSSSIQATNKSPYGKSKLACEEIFKSVNHSNGNPIIIYRLPGIFGKWCKPNYNSVVATFCHNIANNIDLKIIEKDKILKLVYIDDVVKSIFKNLNKKYQDINFIDINPEYKISVQKLSEYIKRFKESRINLKVDRVGTGFLKKLYATYSSYQHENQFSYPLEKKSDQRGDFVEILKTANSGQFAYFTAYPGITRGGHFHHTKCEKFVVVEGIAKFTFRNILNKKYYEKIAESKVPEVVESIPGWIHNIKNIGSDKLVVFVWSSEVFDASNPDTYASKV